MAKRVALDTTFLIDLQRERPAGGGPAHDFLESDPERQLHLSSIALGELAEGFRDPDDPMLRMVREGHVILGVDAAIALRYGRLTRGLRARGRLIGSNDLWIAATCLQHAVPLVTRNVEQFRRVEGLEVIGY